MARDGGVHPDCPNAPNPFHICAEYCPHGPSPRSNVPENKEILVSNGVVREENGAKVAETTENPREPLPRSNMPGNKEILVLNGVGSKGNGGKVEGGRRRSVDPLCVNASNPFHQCADYCVRRTHDGKSTLNGSKFGGTKETAAISGSRKVNPNCPNASNPFHQCADYCSARSAAVDQHKRGNLGESTSKRGLIVAQRKDVNPGCVNASNPFHKCTEHCSQTRRN